MAVSQDNRALYIDKIKKEYGSTYDFVKWVNPREISSFTEKRSHFLSSCHENLHQEACSTKFFSNRLSPGCKVCMSGEWSCLFITGICNGSCFYCPAPQNEDSPPVSQNIEFNSPKDYADYVERFKFKGASISGGEPLIKWEKCVEYIKELNNRFGKDFHIWLYTNGILGTKEKFKALKDAGLKEIRFDIGANAYNLESLKMASDYFDCLTVEIPAVPEDKELLMVKLPEMEKIGVKYLNLHQLRLTPHNFKNLVERNYTFSHGVRAVCVESEITALELMNYTLDNNIDIGINYCSFAYKTRFQSAAWRRKGAQILKKDYDDITESGYLRRVFITGTNDFLKTESDSLFNKIGNNGWALDGNKLFIKFDLLGLLQDSCKEINIDYFEPRIVPFISYYNYFEELNINDNKNLAVERVKMLGIEKLAVSGAVLSMSSCVLDKLLCFCKDKDAAFYKKLNDLEQIERNLPEYF